MTDEELIEQVARALNSALAFEVERDVYAGETTHEERCAIARAILPIIKADRAELVAGIVAMIHESFDAPHIIDAGRKIAAMIETKFGGRDGR